MRSAGRGLRCGADGAAIAGPMANDSGDFDEAAVTRSPFLPRRNEEAARIAKRTLQTCESRRTSSLSKRRTMRRSGADAGKVLGGVTRDPPARRSIGPGCDRVTPSPCRAFAPGPSGSRSDRRRAGPPAPRVHDFPAGQAAAPVFTPIPCGFPGLNPSASPITKPRAVPLSFHLSPIIRSAAEQTSDSVPRSTRNL